MIKIRKGQAPKPLTRAEFRERFNLRFYDPAAPSRVLIVCASARNDGTCPGEIAKTWRFAESARHVVQGLGVKADVLDLSFRHPFVTPSNQPQQETPHE